MRQGAALPPRVKQRLGCLLLGDLLDRTSETRGNAVDADSDVASETGDETGNLAEKLVLGGQLGDSLNIISGNGLAVGDTAPDPRTPLD